MNMRRAIILAVALVIGLALVTGALAQGGASITWWVLGSGGGSASRGGVVVNDTLGQPVAGPASYDITSLGAGYWYGIPVEYRILLPLVLRDT
jgi:hypothetical protein